MKYLIFTIDESEIMPKFDEKNFENFEDAKNEFIDIITEQIGLDDLFSDEYKEEAEVVKNTLANIKSFEDFKVFNTDLFPNDEASFIFGYDEANVVYFKDNENLVSYYLIRS